MSRNPYVVGAQAAPPDVTTTSATSRPCGSPYAAVSAATDVVNSEDRPSTSGVSQLNTTGANNNNTEIGVSTATTSTAMGSVTSGKNLVLQRRVKELLDMPVNHELKELIEYLKAVAPTPTTNRSATTTTTSTTTTATGGSPGGKSTTQPQTHAAGGAAIASIGPGTVARKSTAPSFAPAATTTAPTSTSSSSAAAATNTSMPVAPQALRTLLESRATSIHKEYLQQFASLYDAFRSASASVQNVNQRATDLAQVVNAQATQTEQLVLQIATLQTELQMVQQRSEAVREFKHKFLFGAEEQRVLEKDPITPAYLDVLDRARDVHRKSRLLLAQRGAGHQSLSRDDPSTSSTATTTTNAAATAVMESTYTAIVHATMRIARFVNTALSSSVTSSAAIWSDNATSSSSAATRELMLASAAHNVNTDEPDLSAFLLRCLNLLRHEDVPQWEQVMEEVARLRRASVLRQYHHLLTTGAGASSQSGTYQSGGAGTGRASSMPAHGDRPLEAELDDPVFFFGSLFAWLHQTVVVEQAFMHRIWSASEDVLATDVAASAEEQDPTKKNSTAAGAAASAAAVVSVKAPTKLSESSLLSTVFSGVCKQLASVLEAALLRLSKVTTDTSYLTSSSADTGAASPSSLVASQTLVRRASDHAAGGATTTTAAAATKLGGNPGFQGQNASTGQGPRGLTGRLTKLLFAATGRSMQPKNFVENADGTRGVPATHLGGDHGAGAEAWASAFNPNQGKLSPRIAPYMAVHTRDQQISTATTLLDGVLRAAQIAFSLLQLVEYYSAATFTPLLGAEAELTVYVGVTAKAAISEFYTHMLMLLVAHWLDSVSAMVVRQGVLRRLAGAANATNAATTTATTSSSHSRVLSHFVLDYLIRHQQETAAAAATAATGADDGGVYSGNAEQVARRTAFDLSRALHELVLPASPEVGLCVSAFDTFVHARQEQEGVLAAVADAAQPHETTTTTATTSAAAAQRQSTEAVSAQSLFLAHALAHFAAFLSADADRSKARNPESNSAQQQAEQEQDQEGVANGLMLTPTLAALRDRDTYAPLVHALDDACKAVMCMNTYRAALSVVHARTTPSASAESRSHIVTSLVSLAVTMETSWQRSRDALLSLLAEAAAGTYFAAFLSLVRLRQGPGDNNTNDTGSSSTDPASLSLNSRSQYGVRNFSAFPPELLERLAEKRVTTTTSAGSLSASSTSGQQQQQLQQQQQQQQQQIEHRLVKDALAELYDFYNRVAATGVMPSVPLLSAVTDDADRAALARDLLKRVCEQYQDVYEELKARVAPPRTTETEESGEVDSQGRLVLLAGEWAAFEDMEPRKLRVLIG